MVGYVDVKLEFALWQIFYLDFTCHEVVSWVNIKTIFLFANYLMRAHDMIISNCKSIFLWNIKNMRSSILRQNEKFECKWLCTTVYLSFHLQPELSTLRTTKCIKVESFFASSCSHQRGKRVTASIVMIA